MEPLQDTAIKTNGRNAVVCGPIHGIPNFQIRFRRAQGVILEAGWSYCLTPLDTAPDGARAEAMDSGRVAPGTPIHQQALRACIRAIVTEAHDLFFLPGWEHSTGARLEHDIGWHCGLVLYEFEPWYQEWRQQVA